MAKTANLNILGGLPFEVGRPRYNAETEAAMQEAKRIIAGQTLAKRYSSAKELFEELDAELEKAERNAAYLEKLERGLAQIRAGHGIVKTMDELEAMAED